MDGALSPQESKEDGMQDLNWVRKKTIHHEAIGFRVE